jgi:hypothetical protein
MKQFMEVLPNEYHEIFNKETVVDSKQACFNYDVYYYACPNYGINSWRRYHDMDYAPDVRPIFDEDQLVYRGHVNKFTKYNVLEAFENSKYGSIDDIADALIHNENVRFDQTSALSEFLKSTIDREYNNLNNSLLTWADVTKVLSIFNPTECPKTKGHIAMFLTHKDKARERVTSMKGGKAIRRMFAHLSNQHVASITEDYIEHTTPRDFELVFSQDAHDFVRAYEGDTVQYRNPRLECERKNLATSCMQGVGRYDDYDCEGTYYSVAEAYASGDFGILYVKDKTNRIAGRTVVGIHRMGTDVTYVHQSMYGACEQSMDMMKEHLDFMGSTFHNDTHLGWYGLKLKVLGDRYDPIVPYVDGEYRCDFYHSDANFFVLNDDGEYSLTETDGTISTGQLCGCCQEMEQELQSTPDGDSYCQYCFDEHYLTCAINDEIIHNEDSVYAYMDCGKDANGESIIRQQDMHMDETVFVEFVEEFWYIGDCSLHEESDEYIPNHLFNAYLDMYKHDNPEEVTA